MIILIGYICFFTFYFGKSILKDRERKIEKAREAANAARESIAPSTTGTGNEGSKKLKKILIDTAVPTRSARKRRTSTWNWKTEPSRLREQEIRETYELSDLPPRDPSSNSNEVSTSLHVHWGTEVGRSRHHGPQPIDGEGANRKREAQIWSGLSARDINDIDEGTRVRALQQLREMQTPTQTDFGDDDCWSPVGMGPEEVRKRSKGKRRERGR